MLGCHTATAAAGQGRLLGSIIKNCGLALSYPSKIFTIKSLVTTKSLDTHKTKQGIRIDLTIATAV